MGLKPVFWLPMPSMVVIFSPFTEQSGRKHELREYELLNDQKEVRRKAEDKEIEEVEI